MRSLRLNALFFALCSLPVAAMSAYAAPKHAAATAGGSINVGRVQSISVLVVDSSGNGASSHGHAAIRVTYAGRPSWDDTVVEFTAEQPNGEGDFLEELGMGTGIAGHYPSHISTVRYRDFYAHYIDRGITSLVLKLDRDQQTRLGQVLNNLIAQGHGRRPYQILIYNCAVMVNEAIEAALGREIGGGGKNFPDNLPKIYEANDLVRERVYDAAHQ